MHDMYTEFTHRLITIHRLYLYKQCKGEFLLLQIESDGKHVTKSIKQYFNLLGTEIKKTKTNDLNIPIQTYVDDTVYDLIINHGWKCCDWFADITQEITIGQVRSFIENSRNKLDEVYMENKQIEVDTIASKIKEFKTKANRPHALDSDVKKLINACGGNVDLAVKLILEGPCCDITDKSNDTYM